MSNRDKSNDEYPFGAFRTGFGITSGVLAAILVFVVGLPLVLAVLLLLMITFSSQESDGTNAPHSVHSETSPSDTATSGAQESKEEQITGDDATWALTMVKRTLDQFELKILDSGTTISRRTDGRIVVRGRAYEGGNLIQYEAEYQVDAVEKADRWRLKRLDVSGKERYP